MTLRDLFGAVSDPRPEDPVAEILVVCHANIARSPLAMALLEAEAHRRLGPTADVWVRSAGVHALEGQPAAAESVRQADLRGLDLSRHRGAALTRRDVEGVDLVLTMTERQRSAAVRLCQAAHQRVFTLPEFARLCESVDPDELADADAAVRERVRRAVTAAHRQRPRVPRPDEPEDVADPFGGPRRGYERMAAELESHVARIAPLLFGGPRGV